jgi:DNA-binding GntR family transcriptional regulator
VIARDADAAAAAIEAHYSTTTHLLAELPGVVVGAVGEQSA